MDERQDDKRSHERERHPEVSKAVTFRRFVVLQVFGHQQHDGDFRRLRWLQPEKTKIDPALRAAAGVTDDQHQR